MSERWRGVIAALLNPDLRAALGELSADTALTPARRERALARLEDLGLVRRGDEGVRFDDGVLHELLAESAAPRPEGPQRYLGGVGRIVRYPVRDADRQELLVWVVDAALRPGEVLTEPALNERLTTFTDDVALLRRHLVDAGLVERTRSGSEYARVE